MPGMDGYTMAELMRGTQKGWNRALKDKGPNAAAKKVKKYCPIVAITAHRDNDYNPLQIKKAKLNETVFKPVGLVEITALLKTYYFN